MAFGSFDRKNASQPMAEINMVPLIDVVLVLLVIFIVTAPLLSHSVKLELPKASAQPVQVKAEKIDVSIDATGVRFLNGKALSREELVVRLVAEGAKPTPPEMHLRVDQSVPYRVVAETLADASRAGVGKIGFVTDPSTAPAASGQAPQASPSPAGKR